MNSCGTFMYCIVKHKMKMNDCTLVRFYKTISNAIPLLRDYVVVENRFLIQKYTCVVFYWFYSCYFYLFICIFFPSEFEEVLKIIRWPFVTGNITVSAPAPPTEALQRFQILVQYLLQLQLPYPCFYCFQIHMVEIFLL